MLTCLQPLSHSDRNSSRFAVFPRQMDRVTLPSYPRILLTRYCTVVIRSIIMVWDVSKVRDKADVLREAQEKKTSVHFATLMTLCQLKRPELADHSQKYKGRVVLRGDNVKDDFGCEARVVDTLVK